MVYIAKWPGFEQHSFERTGRGDSSARVYGCFTCDDSVLVTFVLKMATQTTPRPLPRSLEFPDTSTISDTSANEFCSTISVASDLDEDSTRQHTQATTRCGTTGLACTAQRRMWSGPARTMEMQIPGRRLGDLLTRPYKPPAGRMSYAFSI
jgi:hypothetical protein